MKTDYIILSGSAKGDDLFDALDSFESDVQDFMQFRHDKHNQYVELVGGISLTSLGDRIYFTQALLVHDEKPKGE